MDFTNWKKISKSLNINGYHCSYIDSEKGNDVVCYLHGYPTCSIDIQTSIPYFSDAGFRIVATDHLGFGLSDKPLNYSYSLKEQAASTLKLWNQLELQNIHLVAHDYGTSIATEILALVQEGKAPINIQSLTLCNGSVHIEFSQLRFIQKLLKSKLFGPIVAQLSTQRIFNSNMKRILSNKECLNKIDLDNYWELLISNNGRKVLPKLTQYINERYQYWDRWIGALRKTETQSLILWGTEDPVAVEAIARALHDDIQNSTLELLNEVGHYPMLENPELWSSYVIQFIKNLKT